MSYELDRVKGIQLYIGYIDKIRERIPKGHFKVNRA